MWHQNKKKRDVKNFKQLFFNTHVWSKIVHKILKLRLFASLAETENVVYYGTTCIDIYVYIHTEMSEWVPKASLQLNFSFFITLLTGIYFLLSQPFFVLKSSKIKSLIKKKWLLHESFF